MTLEEAIAQFPIVAWSQRFMKLADTGGRNIYADCPMCGGKRRLGIDRERKLFHCFRCDDGGHGGTAWRGRANLMQMIMLLEHTDWQGAHKVVYELAGFPEPPPTARPKEPQKLPEEKILLSLCPGHDAYKELKRRNLEHLATSSFVCVDGRYTGRIILPCYWDGAFRGFEAKSYCGQTPKSLFPDWFEPQNTLYLVNSRIADWKRLILTESIFDAESVGPNAVGIFGSTLREGQLSRLLELREKRGIEELVWMLDNDAWDKQKKAILTKTGAFFRNFVVLMPMEFDAQGQLIKEDPNSLGEKRCAALIEARKEVRDELDFLAIENLR